MYSLNVDGIDFYASQNDINEFIKDLLFDYEYMDEDIFGCRQVVCDSKEVMQVIIKSLKESKLKFESYDISTFKSNNLSEFYERLRKPLVVTGMEEYTDFLTREYYNGKSESMGKFIDEGKMRFYNLAINMLRDGFFLQDHIRTVFIFNDVEYNNFLYCAQDFCSYSGCPIDFNQAFKPRDNSNFDNLAKYYNVYKKFNDDDLKR